VKPPLLSQKTRPIVFTTIKEPWYNSINKKPSKIKSTLQKTKNPNSRIPDPKSKP
jgi:hypothetical protein